MDLAKLKIILNNDNHDNHVKENAIIAVLAEDKNVIPLMLNILDHERGQNEELVREMNVELSRSLVTILDPNVGSIDAKKKPYIELKFTTDEIFKFYLKWQHKLRCCFQIEGLP